MGASREVHFRFRKEERESKGIDVRHSRAFVLVFFLVCLDTLLQYDDEGSGGVCELSKVKERSSGKRRERAGPFFVLSLFSLCVEGK